MAQPNVPAASATAAQACLVEPLDAADRRQRHRHLQGAAEEFAAGVGVIDVAQDARAQREQVDRQPVAAHRGFGLGAADQVVPHVAVELGARRCDDLMQILKAIPNLVHVLPLNAAHTVHHGVRTDKRSPCKAAI